MFEVPNSDIVCVEVDKEVLEGKNGTRSIWALTEGSSDAEEEGGLSKQMLRTGKLSDFCPAYEAFPSVFRIVTVSTVWH